MSRRCLGIFCAAVIGSGPLLRPAAAEQPGFSQIYTHNPFSSHYVPLTPIGRSFSGAFIGGSSGGTYTFYSPGYGVGYYPYYYSYYPGYAPFYAPPVFGGAVFPPLVLPPSAQLGPQGVMPFAGVNNPLPAAAPRAIAPVQAQANKGGFGVLAPNVPVVKAAAKPKESNADARARSQRFIVLGDGYFAKQAYSDAYQRYKLAVQSASDMGDGYLRQGLVLVALGRYDAAARSLKRGLLLSPQWADSGFQLDALYGDAGLAKAAHIEALAQESLRAPSADTLFLLGVMLYFDGQAERALPSFQRARELAGGDDAHLDGFLRKLQPQAPGDEAPAPAAPVAGGGVNAGAPGSKPLAVPIAQRGLAPPPATAVAPFSKLPAPVAPARAPATPALPRSLQPAAGTATLPARDL